MLEFDHGDFMFYFLMILSIIVGALMTVVILMQNSKGQGLSGAFGGAAGVGSVLGVRHASDVLAKATWVLAGTLVFIIFLINMFFLPSAATEESIIQRSSAETPMSPAQRQQQAPAQQAPAQQAPVQQTPTQQAPAPKPAPPSSTN